MTVEKKLEDGTLTFSVSGRLDTNTAPELESELKTDGVTGIVFDFSSLEYISSAGLRVLMTAYKAMAASGGSMRIVNSNDTVRGVFEITGLAEVFAVQ